MKLVDHGKDVVLAQDQVLGAIDLDVIARVFAEEDLVAGLDLELAQRAVLLNLSIAHGDHHSLHRLLLGGVGDVQTAGGLALLLEALHENTIVEGTNLHSFCSLMSGSSDGLMR